jgi:hypothetical protein
MLGCPVVSEIKSGSFNRLFTGKNISSLFHLQQATLVTDNIAIAKEAASRDV